jgi:8-oxo-dGTP diphosphatase
MHEQDQTKEPAGLRPTPVVSCFLLRVDGPEPRILLVKRSGRVGSYHERWSGISGFLEPGVSPEEQAYTEIREETGLQANQVRLLRRGQVVEHNDEELRRRWLVHPFLFEVHNPETIALDWENLELRWITPAELASYATVPKLYEAYLSASQGETM